MGADPSGSTTSGTTTRPSNKPNQQLVYSPYTSAKIFMNDIGEHGPTEDSKEYSLPYTCKSGAEMPYLVYNSERDVVEVMGNVEYQNVNCAKHYFFKDETFE